MSGPSVHAELPQDGCSARAHSTDRWRACARVLCRCEDDGRTDAIPVVGARDMKQAMEQKQKPAAPVQLATAQRRAAARDGRPDGQFVVRRGRPAARGGAAG